MLKSGGFLLSAMAVLLAVLAFAGGAQAAPGNPGVPSDPRVLEDERFENNVGATASRLLEYSNSDGVTYTSAPYWARQDQCNGVIVQYEAPTFPAGFCTSSNGGADTVGRKNVRRLADVLGQVRAGVVGSRDPANPANGSTAETQRNHAVTAWTARESGPNDAAVFTSSDIQMPGGGRFVTASIDVAETSCRFRNGENNSRLSFALLAGGQSNSLSDQPIRACTDPGVGYYTSPLPPGESSWDSGGPSAAAGSYVANRAYLVPAGTDSARLEMRDAVGSSQGNDYAFDNVQLLDVTPQLDKAFVNRTTSTGTAETLSFTVTNTSELARKEGWSFTDTLPEDMVVADPNGVGGTCQATIDAAAGSDTITVSNGLLAAGDRSCTIEVKVVARRPSGGDPSPRTFTNGPDNITSSNGLELPEPTSIEVSSTRGLNVTKSTTGSGATRVGDTVDYTVTGRNTGTADYTTENPAVVIDDLSGVLDDADLVADSAQATIDGEVVPGLTRDGNRLIYQGPLASGKDVVITYRVTIKTGGDQRVNNAAFQSDTPYDSANPPATPPCGDASTTKGSACTTFDLSGLEMTKSTETTKLVAGETVTYQFRVVNTGRTVLTGVTVDEGSFNGSGELSDISCPASIEPLDAGEEARCSATYVVTQADVDRGDVTNTATAKGTPPEGEAITTPASEVRIGADSAPAMEFRKSISTEKLVVGETLTYTYVIRNTGNVTLRDVEVDETPFPGSGPLSEIDCPPAAAELAPGAEITCTATYTVTQADFDRGDLINHARASGTPPNNAPLLTENDSRTALADRKPAISLTKTGTATPQRAGGAVAGDQVAYTFEVTNTGNVTLDAISVADPKAGEVRCPQAKLAPGEAMTCVANPYVVTTADVAAGKLVNTAKVGADGPDGTGSVSADAAAELPVAPPPPGTPPAQPGPSGTAGASANAELRVEKVALRRSVRVGNPIPYRITVTNTSQTVARNVRVLDTPDKAVRVRRVSAAQGTCTTSPIACELGDLAPGQSVEMLVTVSSRSQGALRNTVTASAEGATGAVLSATDRTTVRLTGPQARLRVTKRASVRQVASGTVFRYWMKVTNTNRKVMAKRVRLCDPLPGRLTLRDKRGATMRGGQACWSLKNIRPGKSKTVWIDVVASSATRPARIVNQAVASASNARRVSGKAAPVAVAARPARAGGVTG